MDRAAIKGLSEKEAAARLVAEGPNELGSLFHLSPIPVLAFLGAIAVGALSVVWFEATKLLGKKRLQARQPCRHHRRRLLALRLIPRRRGASP